MICEVALATRTAPSQWKDEDDEYLLTALDILREQAEAREELMEEHRRRG